VNWLFETGAVFQGDPNRRYKRLCDGEIYLSEIESTGVSYAVYYKPDQNTVWTKWYSGEIEYSTSDTGFRPRIGLGQPSASVYDKVSNRPMREAYDFQIRVEILGRCKFIGARIAAEEINEPEFAKPA
jgi:hypothetical protein